MEMISSLADTQTETAQEAVSVCIHAGQDVRLHFPDWMLDSRAADGTACRGTMPRQPHTVHMLSTVANQTQTDRLGSQYSRKLHAGSAAGQLQPI